MGTFFRAAWISLSRSAVAEAPIAGVQKVRMYGWVAGTARPTFGVHRTGVMIVLAWDEMRVAAPGFGAVSESTGGR